MRVKDERPETTGFTGANLCDFNRSRYNRLFIIYPTLSSHYFLSNGKIKYANLPPTFRVLSAEVQPIGERAARSVSNYYKTCIKKGKEKETTLYPCIVPILVPISQTYRYEENPWKQTRLST